MAANTSLFIIIGLMILNYIGIVNPDVSLGFWKWYALAETVELIITVLIAKHIDKRDMRTNFGRNK